MSFDTTLGRWLEADPFHYMDSANLYEIQTSSPISNVDPYGLTIQYDGDANFKKNAADVIAKLKSLDPEISELITSIEKSKNVHVIRDADSKRAGIRRGSCFVDAYNSTELVEQLDKAHKAKDSKTFDSTASELLKRRTEALKVYRENKGIGVVFYMDLKDSSHVTGEECEGIPTQNDPRNVLIKALHELIHVAQWDTGTTLLNEDGTAILHADTATPVVEDDAVRAENYLRKILGLKERRVKYGQHAVKDYLPKSLPNPYKQPATQSVR